MKKLIGKKAKLKEEIKILGKLKLIDDALYNSMKKDRDDCQSRIAKLEEALRYDKSIFETFRDSGISDTTYTIDKIKQLLEPTKE